MIKFLNFLCAIDSFICVKPLLCTWSDGLETIEPSKQDGEKPHCCTSHSENVQDI
jgi:hypothetical protein